MRAWDALIRAKLLGAVRLCILALSAFAISAPSASATPWFGFSDKSATGNQASPTQSANLAAQEGATSSRVTINWSWVQPSPGPPNFGTFDAIYNADLARGIRPLFVLTGTPTWAAPPGASCDPGTACNYPPDSSHDSDWQSIASQIATRYPQLAGIEIWNEPNQSYAWGGGFDPARYTQLLKLAYTAIKAANPSMPVIGGALAADLGSGITDTSYPLPLFLQAMYDNGARGSMDGISIHPYPQAMNWGYIYRVMSVTTETRDANGDSVPMWITETGMSTTAGFTTTQQAIVLANLLPALLAYPGVAGAYINSLVDQTNFPPNAPERGLGVLYPNLSPKPAYCTVARAFGTGYRCPLLVADPWPSSTQSNDWRAQNLLQAAANAALAYHKANSGYQGITSNVLNSIDPRISSAPPTVVSPGWSADPSRIGVWFWGPDGVLMCNASRADRSYCIYTQSRGTWIYASTVGNIYNAARALIYGYSNTW
jgi:hypothetical protein